MLENLAIGTKVISLSEDCCNGHPVGTTGTIYQILPYSGCDCKPLCNETIVVLGDEGSMYETDLRQCKNCLQEVHEDGEPDH